MASNLVNMKVDLRSEAGAGVHNERPELVAAGDGGDVEAIVVALVHVLVHARVGHVVVVALLHGPVRVVHCDPLRRWQPQPDLLLRHLHQYITSQAVFQIFTVY